MDTTQVGEGDVGAGCVDDDDGGGGGDDSVCCVVKVMMMIIIYALIIIIDNDIGDLVSNVTVQELCVVHPQLTRLDLSQCKLVTDVGLWAIAKHCLLLNNLILTGRRC